jgi:hypothetical protein
MWCGFSFYVSGNLVRRKRKVVVVYTESVLPCESSGVYALCACLPVDFCLVLSYVRRIHCTNVQLLLGIEHIVLATNPFLGDAVDGVLLVLA